MNPYRRNIIYINQRLLQRPPLWQRWLLALAATAVLVVSFMLGAILLIVVLGIAAIAALLIGIRVWWLRRKLRSSDTGTSTEGDPLRDLFTAVQRQQQGQHGQDQQQANGGRTIDSESEDISNRR
ncbi:MAG: hypothetical protein PF630_06495 [Gammaproteobacteria bacterium]|jgi:predicted lipid-binding transport protein (Tim44 family)|nr:hypothetical protein [Gammaproteobacteria bacterium]